MRPTLPLVAYINRFLCRVSLPSPISPMQVHKNAIHILCPRWMAFPPCRFVRWRFILLAGPFFPSLAHVSRGKEKLALGPRLVTRTTDRLAGWTLFNQCSSSCRSSAQFVWRVPFFPPLVKVDSLVRSASFLPSMEPAPMRMTIFFHVHWSGVFAGSPLSCSVHHLQFS
jgi:hypothetical protein